MVKFTLIGGGVLLEFFHQFLIYLFFYFLPVRMSKAVKNTYYIPSTDIKPILYIGFDRSRDLKMYFSLSLVYETTLFFIESCP